jgi:putative PIN family toxin of toxin-antitoxin system
MQKIVIDTNIIVSSIIQRGYSYQIINGLFIEDKFKLCVSDELLAEYYDVLSRKRFSKYKDFFLRAETLLADIETKAIKYFPKIKLQLISDIDDNKILELADECFADFVITGNTTDFTFPMYKQTKIVTPNEYWESYQPA